MGHIPYSNEACLQKVLEEYPNANGVSLYWREPRWRYDALCYASFGNKLIFKGQGFYGCMFHGISYFIYIYIYVYYNFAALYIYTLQRELILG